MMIMMMTMAMMTMTVARMMMNMMATGVIRARCKRVGLIRL